MLWWVLLAQPWAGTSEEALAVPAEPEEAAHLPNGVSLKLGAIYTINRPRTSAVPGVEAPEAEVLGGFSIAYERVLVPELLTLELAKPFYFAEGRYDSPFEVYAKLNHRWRDWEPFVGLGLTFNLRVFDGERAEVEGQDSDLSAGLAAAAGLVYWPSLRWGIEAEVGYGFIPFSEVTEHEFSAAVGPVYAF